jgi:hypothetical protein
MSLASLAEMGWSLQDRPSGGVAGVEDCSERETWAMPFCDDDWLPEAGDGCYQSCGEGEPACREGTCTHAWLGCGPEDDCGVCGTDGLICM